MASEVVGKGETCQTSLVCITSLRFQNSSAYQVTLSERCFLIQRPPPCRRYRIGLIEKRRMGQGNNTIMYVKNFVKQNTMITQQSNADPISEVQNVNFQKSKISTSKSPKNKLLEVQNMDHNK